MRTNNSTPICIICRTHNRNAGFGIQYEHGVHICMECALDLAEFITVFSEEYEIYPSHMCPTNTRKERHVTHDDGD